MIDQQAISRYARALFLSAQDRNEIEMIDKDFLAFKALADQHSEISHLILNFTISEAEKEDFIEKIVPENSSKLFVNFLKVLIKKRRFRELALIQQEFHRLVEKKKGIQEVKVIAAAKLSRQNETNLISMLKKKLKADIRLKTEVEPDLIGGIVIRFDGTEINASFKNRLLELKQKLMA